MDAHLTPRLTTTDALAYLCSARCGVKVLKKALFAVTAVLALTAAVLHLTGRLDELRGNAAATAPATDTSETVAGWPVSAAREPR